MKKLFAILPCHNEQEDIGPLVEKWMTIRDKWAGNGYELGVYCIDDKSTDNTNSVIHELMERFPDSVHIIEHDVNKGLGGVLNTAFNFFEADGEEGDLLVLMDGDNTHDPVYSLDMLPKMVGGSDCVIASRYCDKSQTIGVAPHRLLMSWGARFFYTILLGVKNVKDYTCGYRMYTYQIIHRAKSVYHEKFVERSSFACMMEVLYKLSLIGVTFSEIDFKLHYDYKQSESKMRLLKTVRNSIGTAFQLRMGRKRIVENLSYTERHK